MVDICYGLLWDVTQTGWLIHADAGVDYQAWLGRIAGMEDTCEPTNRTNPYTIQLLINPVLGTALLAVIRLMMMINM